MNNIKHDFTIKDLENISGVKAHTIRIWEKRYNLLNPSRSSTNIRHYSNKNLQKLLNIVLLNKNNIKISKIAEMSDETITVSAREIAFKSALNDESINAFKIAMFQFDTVLFTKTYEKLLHQKTFREIFKEVFIPFLHQIGLLWQTDTLLPAHEHFISNLITQKIQSNTEKITKPVNKTNKSYVLFLPENEIHELGLLYLNYELALRGLHTIYLGQSLPLNNLGYFFKNEREICFITSLTVQPHNDKIKDYFNEINAILSGTEHQLIAIGRKTIHVNDLEFDANISFYNSIEDVLNVL